MTKTTKAWIDDWPDYAGSVELPRNHQEASISVDRVKQVNPWPPTRFLPVPESSHSGNR
jgi:hypothetical protein